ncbi:AAA family ATPase [Phormidium sp. LEGE 05292]|uniref:AAA family ATPase n=1 Tax=[Phormidium] sp. LEGE 05292 TaxID=767427 RepID=UPI00188002C4|nr:AAA family ATPase [Phormidium sp. LEGE 05292]MBE9225790.1 AAA family ATPase [Phormidium sp. LEGE 05292]
MSESNSSKNGFIVSGRGIDGISVRGYKSLYEECSIEVCPLTILAGANSSGKSSIMQPLLLLKQTLEASYDPGALLLNGPNVKFTSADQLLSHFSEKDYTDSFTIKIVINNNFLISKFTKEKKQGIQVVQSTYYLADKEITISPDMDHDELVKILPEGLNSIYEDYLNDITDEHWNVTKVRSFLDFKLGKNLLVYSELSGFFQKQIRHLIHVPGLRGNPERTYNTTSVGQEFPGTFENYVASVISHWQNTEDNRFIELEADLEKLGLTWKVDAKQLNDVQIELRVGRLPRTSEASDMVSIADVGLGVSQTLPVLVALLVAEPGQLVYLEQPEIHLHPRAQVALAEILSDAANRGVRVVLETHSELLLLAVQSLVAEGKLSPELVKLHWFKRREDGVTEVSSTNLDAAGAFGDWPEDFSDVSLKLESRYLDAAEARLINN